MRMSKEVKKLRNDIIKAHKLCEEIGTRATFYVHIRSEEEQEMADMLGPELGLCRDADPPSCWKRTDNNKPWFYIFDYRK